MILRVANEIYETSRKDIMKFMNEYPKSRFTANGMILYVVPTAIMKLRETIKSKVKLKKLKKKPIVKPESEQLSLFAPPKSNPLM